LPLGELQEPDLGADDLLFGRHGGVLQYAEAGALRHPDRFAPEVDATTLGDGR